MHGISTRPNQNHPAMDGPTRERGTARVSTTRDWLILAGEDGGAYPSAVSSRLFMYIIICKCVRTAYQSGDGVVLCPLFGSFGPCYTIYYRVVGDVIAAYAPRGCCDYLLSTIAVARRFDFPFRRGRASFCNECVCDGLSASQRPL